MRFTDEQIAAIIAKAEENARARHKNFGKKFSEIDFIAGMGTMFDALGAWDQVPAYWLFGPLSGRRVFTKEGSDASTGR